MFQIKDRRSEDEELTIENTRKSYDFKNFNCTKYLHYYINFLNAYKKMVQLIITLSINIVNINLYHNLHFLNLIFPPKK